MKTQEFCYWLQGYFELGPATTVLDADRLAIIRAHIKLVKLTDGEQLSGFVAWLDCAIDMMGESWTARETDKVRAKLADVFEHVIDPGYGLDKKTAAVVHGGGGTSNPHALIRC